MHSSGSTKGAYHVGMKSQVRINGTVIVGFKARKWYHKGTQKEYLGMTSCLALELGDSMHAASRQAIF